MKTETPPLMLASASPRRRELLAGLGLEFSALAAHMDETLLPGESAESAAERLAIGKASAIDDERSVILAADTLVVCGDHILGKPQDAGDAGRMLRELSGQEHRVLTGVALRHGARVVAAVDSTQVRIAHLDECEIAWYIETGEPMDKAGAYAIQGLGALFVESIEGNYSNVVGLPIPLVARLARSLGWSLDSWM